MRNSFFKTALWPTLAVGTIGTVLVLQNLLSTKSETKPTSPDFDSKTKPVRTEKIVESNTVNSTENSTQIQNNTQPITISPSIKSKTAGTQLKGLANSQKKNTEVFDQLDYQDISSAPKQSFRLDPTKKQTVTGEQGTILTFEPNILAKVDGSAPVGKVNLNLVEAYDWKDYIKYDLPTIATDQPIISGGVIFTSATDEAGNQLNIKPGEEFEAFFPLKDSSNMDVKMQDFYGVRDESGELNWLNQDEYRKKKNLPAAIKIELSKSDSLKKVYKFKSRNERNLTPIDVEDLDYDQFFCSSDRYVRRQIRMLNDEKYQYTYIATLPFAERLHALTQYPYSKRALKIYLSNTDKKLWEVDQMVVEMYEKKILDHEKPVHENNYKYLKRKGTMVGYRWTSITPNTIDPVVFFRKMASQRWGNMANLNKPVQILGRLPKKYQPDFKVNKNTKKYFAVNKYLKEICANSNLRNIDVKEVKSFMVNHNSIENYLYTVKHQHKHRQFYRGARLRGIPKTEQELEYTMNQKIQSWNERKGRKYREPFTGVYYRTKRKRPGFALKLLSLGLANCDGYYNIQTPVATDIQIDLQAVKEKFTGRVYVIMNNRRTMIRGKKTEGNSYKIKRVPLNKSYKIVAIGKDGEEKVLSVKKARSKQRAKEEIEAKYDDSGPAKFLVGKS